MIEGEHLRQQENPLFPDALKGATPSVPSIYEEYGRLSLLLRQLVDFI